MGLSLLTIAIVLVLFLIQNWEKIIESNGGKYLESYALFDLYEGNQIKIGYKSVAYSITFRASDRTLDEEAVKEPIQQIIHALEEKGIDLRK